MRQFFSNFWGHARASIKRRYASLQGWSSELFEPRYRLVTVNESFPRKLQPYRLYVLLEGGTPWQAAMICPCGCNEILELNLLPDEHPRWTFRKDKKGYVTLEPSIDRQIGCRSHFFLRAGKIIWAMDNFSRRRQRVDVRFRNSK